MKQQEREIAKAKSASADEPKKTVKTKPRKGPVKKAAKKLVDEFWMMVADLIVWLRRVLGIFTEHAIALVMIIIFHENF